MKKVFKIAIVAGSIGYLCGFVERVIIITKYLKETTTLEAIGKRAYKNGVFKEGINLRNNAYEWFINT